MPNTPIPALQNHHGTRTKKGGFKPDQADTPTMRINIVFYLMLIGFDRQNCCALCYMFGHTIFHYFKSFLRLRLRSVMQQAIVQKPDTQTVVAPDAMKDWHLFVGSIQAFFPKPIYLYLSNCIEQLRLQNTQWVSKLAFK